MDDYYDLPLPASSVQKNSNQGKNPATPKFTPQQLKKKSSSTSSALGSPRGLPALSAPPAPNPKEDSKPQSTHVAPTLPSGKKHQGGNTTSATSSAAKSSKAAPKTGEQPIKQATPQTGAPPKPPVESPAPPPQLPRQADVTSPEKGSGKRKTPLPERKPGLPKTQPGSTSSSTSLTTPLLDKEEVKKKHETSDITEPDSKRARIDAGPETQETVAEKQRSFELGEKFWEAAENIPRS